MIRSSYSHHLWFFVVVNGTVVVIFVKIYVVCSYHLDDSSFHLAPSPPEWTQRSLDIVPHLLSRKFVIFPNFIVFLSKFIFIVAFFFLFFFFVWFCIVILSFHFGTSSVSNRFFSSCSVSEGGSFLLYNRIWILPKIHVVVVFPPPLVCLSVRLT